MNESHDQATRDMTVTRAQSYYADVMMVARRLSAAAFVKLGGPGATSFEPSNG